jgi:hypothetical protein
MLTNTWSNIIEWFNDRSQRSKLIRSFNDSARNAFVIGIAPTLLKASISKGESSYRHHFSDWLNTGFRIQAFSGRLLTKKEFIQIGEVIINNNILIRRLIVLGWDTLEIHGDKGPYACRWQLKDYIQLSQSNNNDDE